MSITFHLITFSSDSISIAHRCPYLPHQSKEILQQGDLNKQQKSAVTKVSLLYLLRVPFALKPLGSKIGNNYNPPSYFIGLCVEFGFAC